MKASGADRPLPVARFQAGSRFAAPLAAMAGSNAFASARLRTATSVACSAEHATLEPA
ncbi:MULTISPECIES: hypothetical protein [Ensifer]|uniref:Uncharacterized protein n=1 Tax=Ensifer adhaerens TaxID=106592 RepID=A0ABY8HKA6_ENSAD|nr:MULTISPECIES: hypothetical protein [Ensifer]MBD9540410.1 hypothetical protein [Ensifer sp. ENS04]MDF8354800.1 hypothetical protein [Ensifer adhaerens]WFP92568.1 hypothetical protein P4B07_09475 [Ensifer adhaerens]